MSKNTKHITVKPLFSNSRVNRKKCKSGKISYKNELSAKHALTTLHHHASESRGEKRIYRCDDCGYFHLTSMSNWSKPKVKNIDFNAKRSTNPINFRDINRALDEVSEKFAYDPALSLILYNAINEFKIYTFSSTADTLHIINTVLGEIFQDAWSEYKNMYSNNL